MGLVWRLVFVSTICASFCSAITPAEARAWRQDLRFMVTAMQRTHKDLYHSISAESFATMVASLNDQIPSLTRAEIIVQMARIVAAVGDGHTNIYPTRDPTIGFRTLPVQFTFFGNELYVRAVLPDQRALLGARVIRIGNLPIADAYATAKTMIGHENEGGAHYWAQYLLAMPEVLQALHITSQAEDVPLTLDKGQGAETVVLHPAVPVEIMSGDISTLFHRRQGWLDVRDLSPGPEPLWLRHIDLPFQFEHVGDLLYVQINQVSDGPDETLAQFARRLHDEIATTKPDEVAIDLRQNRGGDATLIVPLVRSIIQCENIDRKGHLFGIIGPATFSAAQNLTDVLEKYTNILFVGEPTGSKGNTFGDSRKIVLPNSGITVRAAIYYWQDWHPLDRREETTPQIAAPMTMESYRRKTDPALDVILNYKSASSK